MVVILYAGIDECTIQDTTCDRPIALLAPKTPSINSGKRSYALNKGPLYDKRHQGRVYLATRCA